MADGSNFECQPDEFCMMWSHCNECSCSVEGISDKKTENSCINNGFARTTGYTRCKLITVGYLRKNDINPKDIATIITKHLVRSDNIKFSISNDHYSCMILFPSMKQVCINFENIFDCTNNIGCDDFRCKTMCWISCGIIGIPQSQINEKFEYNDQNLKRLTNMKKFYQLFKNYDQEITNDKQLSFVNLKHELSLVMNSMLLDKDKDKNKNKEKSTVKAVKDPSGKKKVKMDLEMIECKVLRDERSKSLHHTIEYNCDTDGKSNEFEWASITTISSISIKKNGSGAIDTFAFQNGDEIVLEYNKHDNTLFIQLCHYKTLKSKDLAQVQKKDTIIVTKTANTQPRIHSLPIEAKNDKLILKKGYDYVLACCINGCNNRAPGKTNQYKFTGNHHCLQQD